MQHFKINELPNEIITIILTHCITIKIPSRFVCRFWNNLLCTKTLFAPSTDSVKFIEECAACGYLNLLKWAWSKGANINILTGYFALKNQQISVLIWLSNMKIYTKNPPYLLESSDKCFFAREATKLGKLDILKENLIENDSTISNIAAQKGYSYIIKWLIESNRLIDPDIHIIATAHGNLELLQCLHNLGYPIPSSICHCAARFGHLAILKWTVEIGVFSQQNCLEGTASAGYRYPYINDWLKDNL
jgi:hypothetical protein